jgi:hypothetical protein
MPGESTTSYVAEVVGVVDPVFHQEGRVIGGSGAVTERGTLIYELVDGMIARVITRRDNDAARAEAERLAEERA